MSEEDLELLITLDDPRYAQEEDTFNHLQVNNLEYWLGQQFRNGNRIEPANKNLDIVLVCFLRTSGGLQ